ncbi:MAG: T9SS type A sorting domain-containing protein [Rhodothermia bacterium]
MTRRIVALPLSFLLFLLFGMSLHLDLGDILGDITWENRDSDDPNARYFRSVGSRGDGSSSQLVPGITSARMEPFAIRIGEETARLIIGIDDTSVVAMRMQAGDLSLDGDWLDSFTLVDDGTQGDEVAGDGLFTRDQLTITRVYEAEAGNLKRNFRSISFANLTFVFGDGREEQGVVNLGFLALIGVDPSVEIPSISRGTLADSIHHTDYVVNIVTELEGAFPDFSINFEELAKQYYTVLPDDRDFLIFSVLFNTGFAGGFYLHVISDVEGIGRELWDNSSDYGSAGRLEGLIRTTYPSASVLNHEMLHRSAAFLDDLNMAADGHWKTVERSGTGFNLTTNRVNNGIYREIVKGSADNEYRAMHIDYSGVYNDLELYLMGLIPAAEVATPIRALINPAFQETVSPFPDCVVDGDPTPCISQTYDVYQADGIREIELEDIVGAVGERLPDYRDEQKAFTSALVVVYDRPLTDVEFAALDFQMREYEKSMSDFGPLSHTPDHTFEDATGGRATLETRIALAGTGVAAESVDNEFPPGYVLYPNYPNPFNPTTTLTFDIPQTSDVAVDVFSLSGQRVRRLADRSFQAGTHSITFSAEGLPSGTYVVKMSTVERELARLVTLLK